MEILRECSRRELLEFYLSREREKGGREISLGSVDIENPNALDRDFASKILKTGRIPGYRTWKYAKIWKEDLLGCAIYNGVFGNKYSQVLGNLLKEGTLDGWTPNRNTTWFLTLDAIGKNFMYPEKWALILTHPTKNEAAQGAKWYIEDGSGRAICFLRAIHSSGSNDFAYAYIGGEIDFRSNFMKEKYPDRFPQ